MNTELHDKLVSDGYLLFHLDNETIEKLKPIADKIKKVEFTTLKHTNCGNSDSTNDSFENLEKLKEQYAPLKRFQVWYEDNNFRPKMTNEEYTFIRNLFISIVENLYPDDSYDDNFHIYSTMYNKMCYINNHQDGTNDLRLTNILIYLNEDYKDGMGGELVIQNDIKIKPELGNVAILDFSQNNPLHAVSEVLDENFRRIAMLVAIGKKFK